VEHLPWSGIAELRNHKDIDAFRKILVEIEAAAAEAESGFAEAVQKAYEDAVAAAERRMNGSTLRNSVYRRSACSPESCWTAWGCHSSVGQPASDLVRRLNAG
jgi:hypothetical protein